MSLADALRELNDVVMVKIPGSEELEDAAEIIQTAVIKYLEIRSEWAATSSSDFGRGYAFAIQLLRTDLVT